MTVRVLPKYVEGGNLYVLALLPPAIVATFYFYRSITTQIATLNIDTQVADLVPDTKQPGYTYAHLTDFMPFGPSVPFKLGGLYREAPLRALEPKRVGAFLQGKSIRLISDEDFAAITALGLGEMLRPENMSRLAPDDNQWGEEAAEYIHEPIEDQQRHIEKILLNKKIRAANFRRQVCDAYENTCAVTRLCIINGGGRAEVQAAHIWSVEAGGPDVVQNGLALSGTIHWLFDRHLISLTDDHRLLISHNKVPAELRGLFAHQDWQIHLPKDKQLWPHPAYIARHRERFTGVG